LYQPTHGSCRDLAPYHFRASGLPSALSSPPPAPLTSSIPITPALNCELQIPNSKFDPLGWVSVSGSPIHRLAISPPLAFTMSQEPLAQATCPSPLFCLTFAVLRDRLAWVLGSLVMLREGPMPHKTADTLCEKPHQLYD
jgi:hypothetical protein